LEGWVRWSLRGAGGRVGGVGAVVVERCGEDLLEGRVGARPEVVGDLSKGWPASRRGLAPRALGRGWRAASERVEACTERSWRQSPRGPESVFESCGGRRRGACAGLTARPPRVVVDGHGSQPFECLRAAPSPARRKCFDQLLQVSHGGVRRALNAAASRSGKSSQGLRASPSAGAGCGFSRLPRSRFRTGATGRVRGLRRSVTVVSTLLSGARKRRTRYGGGAAACPIAQRSPSRAMEHPAAPPRALLPDRNFSLRISRTAVQSQIRGVACPSDRAAWRTSSDEGVRRAAITDL
jgi:hypothetical protein